MKHLVRLIAGLAVAAIALTAGELALRAALGPPPPPVKVMRMVGDVERYLSVVDGIATPTFQGQLATPAFSVSSDRQRVIVIGGSSVHQAFKHRDSELEFPARLGQRLGVAVLNLGVPGADSYDVAALSAELGQVDHDVLVIYTGHNDLGNAAFQGRYTGTTGAAQARALSQLERSQIFVQLRLAVMPASPHARKDQEKRVAATLSAQQRARAARYLITNLERAIWSSRQAGVPVVLAVPVGDLSRQMRSQGGSGLDAEATALFEAGLALRHTDPQRAASLLRQARDLDARVLRAPTAMQDAIRGLAAPDVQVVDLPAVLPQEKGIAVPASFLFLDNIHFSREGHDAVARALDPAVREALARCSTSSTPCGA